MELNYVTVILCIVSRSKWPSFISGKGNAIDRVRLFSLCFMNDLVFNLVLAYTCIVHSLLLLLLLDRAS